MTDMPVPRQSSSSSRACSNTSSGITAGPALKLKTRVIVKPSRETQTYRSASRSNRLAPCGRRDVLALPCIRLFADFRPFGNFSGAFGHDAFQSNQAIAFVEPDQPHALSIA